MQHFPPGSYTFKITGTAENVSAYETFIITLVDPCPSSTLTLLPSPFTDQVVWRHEDVSQQYAISNLATQSVEVDCGDFAVEFFNDDLSALDESIFLDNKKDVGNNEFTVLKAEDGDLKVGVYSIVYRVSLVDYEAVEVV